MDNPEQMTKEISTYLKRIHELYLPQKLLDFAVNPRRHQFYQAAINSAVSQKDEINSLHTGMGSVLSAMLAAKYGANRVWICEPWNYLAAIYRTIIDNNGLTDRISVIGKNVSVLNLDELSDNPDLLVLDCLDASLLGNGIAEIVNYAHQNLFSTGIRIIPNHATVFAAPVELRTGEINGFDLSPFNRYRWNVCFDEIQLGSEPFNFLAAAVECFSIDFRQSITEAERNILFKITHPGRLNAIAFWYELHLDEQTTFSTAPEIGQLSEQRQALIYLEEEVPLSAGESFCVNVKHDCFRITIKVDELKPELTQYRYFKASVPHWHFPMIADQVRNNAFQDAIRKAIQRTNNAHVLDIGTGTGLLAMMASQSGAESVTACEMIPHIAKTATDILKKNDCDKRINLIPKLSQHLKVPGDMKCCANILVSETVDHSLLGERFLETLIHARKALLEENPIIIPAKATVFAMAIELRFKQLQNLNFEVLNLLRLNHYAGFALKETDFQPLTDVFEAFKFDFYEKDFQASQQFFNLPITKSGICNAVAFWFHMHLDDEIVIKTDPKADSTAWQQAVVFFDSEIEVKKGDILPVIGQHDLYRLSFNVDQLECIFRGINIRSLKVPDWYSRMLTEEAEIQTQTGEISKLIEQCPQAVVEESLENIVKNITTFGFEPTIVSDFVKHLRY
jgi:predicted RNA methylase